MQNFRQSRGQTYYERIHDGKPLVKIAAECNQQEANRLRGIAREADRYVEWQQGRIAGWEPKPIQPIPGR